MVEVKDSSKISTTESRDSSPVVNTNSGDFMTGISLYLCLASLTLVLFITALDILIVGTIIDVVAEQFGNYSKTGWLVTGYSLPNAILSLLWGRFASIIGFQYSLILAILIFEAGSLVAALADSMNMLIVGRVVAGVGGSGLQTLCFVIGCTMVDERSRPLVISILSCAFAVAAIVGPIIGGAFTTHVTWRWCFYINLPIGGLAIIMFLLTYKVNSGGILQQTKKIVKMISNFDFSKLKKKMGFKEVVNGIIFKFDFFGFALSSTGLVLFLLGLTFGGNKYSWNSGQVIVYLVLGILLSIFSLIYDFFIFHKFNPQPDNMSYRPLFLKRLVANPAVIMVNMVTFLLCIGYNGQMIYSVQFFQLIFASSAWKAGLHLIPIVITNVIAAIASGVITKKFGLVKPLLTFGGFLGVIGSGLMTLMSNNSTSSTQIGVLLLPGFSLGFALQASLMSAQLQINKDRPEAAMDFIEITAFNTFMKSLGTTLGGVLSTTVFSASLHNKVSQAHLEPYVGETVDSMILYRLHNFDGSHSAIANTLSDSIKNVFWMDLGFYALGFIFCIFSSNKRLIIPKNNTEDE
ncbi:hypothetical protein SEUBUCD650_0M04680 [Saccharomyces eubayanus]|uniref:Major facilitator superfamily (MFS) profile domain-containing protein n=1 Tax=Saccharomyces eubayanus TaxID=1080349 RepID=A0ABN8VM08_SACEU|nr:hypothetical protein SEUBUCD650_0M04680 [Saccharomyces eubayanus]